MTHATLDLDRQRRRLLEEQARLEQELAAFSPESPLTPGADMEVWEHAVDNHLADEGSELYEREKSLSLERSLRQMLEEVRRALEKLDSGTYGICDNCGRPIAPERLEALPHATLCLECRAELDRERVRARMA
jgi:DnaK suppressor protein